MRDTQLVANVIWKRHHFALHLPPRLILFAGALLAWTLLAGLGSVLLAILRSAAR